jgi:hypothetical protein
MAGIARFRALEMSDIAHPPHPGFPVTGPRAILPAMIGERGTPRHRGRMLVALLAVAPAVIFGPPAPAGAQGADQEPAYDALWASGQTYEAFYAEARGRRSLWEHHTARAEVPEGLLVRARAVPGSWRLLAIAFDRCSDSVGTIPYIAALASRVDGFELRIIPPESGEAIMESHRTPDGRTATPTVVVLDGAGRVAGAWVERPSQLQAWYLANPDSLSHDARYFEKMLWYDEDAGVSTMTEIVALVEAAGTAP